MTSPPLPTASNPKRNVFVTVLAWLMMIIGVIGLPVSLISGMLVVTKSYGTRTSDPLGFIIVVLGPAIVLITGFGLLRRWSLALMATIFLLSACIIQSGWQLLQGPRPTTTYTSPSGTMTTVIGSGANYHSVPVMAVCVGLLAKLSTKGVRQEFQFGGLPKISAPQIQSTPTKVGNAHPEWRVGHRGRDMMYYEEKVNGRWQRLDIDGEMLMGQAHHVIYFASKERWESYPEWARHRRAEIITRIKSEFRAPDYEYQGGES